MKKLLSLVLIFTLPLITIACKKSSPMYRLSEVSYRSGSETITLTSRDLKELITPDFQPYGGLEDNYFFCLKFDGEKSGKAVFLYSEISDDYTDVVADMFNVEEKSGNRISLVFTNGSALSGTKTKNTITLSGNGVSFTFQRI